MSDSTKISAFHIENVKRIKAVAYQPTTSGLTVIGGKNGQGKTSVLDALAWGLGGDRLKPSRPDRDGSLSPPDIDITLSNGVRVMRKGKNSSLTVLDPEGKRAGQTLLNAFVSEFALDLPRFLIASSTEKANILLKILGIGEELKTLDREAERLYNQRHDFGIEVTKKEKYSEECREHADAPPEPVSVSELLSRHKTILAQNAENDRLRQNADRCRIAMDVARATVVAMEEKLAAARAAQAQAEADYVTASKSAEALLDESTEAIEADLARIEQINAMVAANAEKVRAADEANEYRARYAAMSVDLEAVRRMRIALLADANLPLPGLSVENGELLYSGQPWDCMSGSEQLRVGTSIVRRLKPECGFVFLDKLEGFDIDSLSEFASWAEAEDLQVLGTRVSVGEECSLIIEDGLPLGMTYADVVFEGAPAPDTSKAMDW